MRFPRLVIVAALAAVWVFSPPSARASDFWDEVRRPGISQYRRLIEQAELALRARRLTDALALADEAIEIMPDAPKGHLIRGLAAGERGAVDDGAQSIARALEIDPMAVDGSLAERATTVLLRGNALAPARGVLERAVRNAGPGAGRDDLFATYGDVLMASGPEFLDTAIRAYREALRATGRSGRAKLGLALALRRQGAEAGVWRPLAVEAADTTARQLLLALSLPPGELESRGAILMEVAGDDAGALAAWRRATSGPWSVFAQGAAAALGGR